MEQREHMAKSNAVAKGGVKKSDAKTAPPKDARKSGSADPAVTETVAEPTDAEQAAQTAELLDKADAETRAMADAEAPVAAAVEEEPVPSTKPVVEPPAQPGPATPDPEVVAEAALALKAQVEAAEAQGLAAEKTRMGKAPTAPRVARAIQVKWTLKDAKPKGFLFKTLKGARDWLVKIVGTNPMLGEEGDLLGQGNSAVIESGATIEEFFPELAEAEAAAEVAAAGG
jgi:hypothetical protein